MLRAALPSALLAVAALALAATPARAAQLEPDPLDSLARSIDRLSRSDGAFELLDAAHFKKQIADAELAVAAQPSREREFLRLVLDLATCSQAGSDGTVRADLDALGRRALQVRLATVVEPGVPSAAETWLVREVIPSGAGFHARQRELAIELVRGRAGSDVARALLVAASADDAGVRACALDALAPRSEPEVRRFFVRALERGAAEGDRDVHTHALAHLRTTRPVVEPDLAQRIYRLAQDEIGAESWRRASNGVALASALELQRAGPLLIESLALWKRRSDDGKGGLRIQHEIARELERYSGKQFGVRLPSWRAWWRATSADATAPVKAEPDAHAAEYRTEAGFFGIRIQSDRVVFVIDRSGSMADTIGYEGRSRYEEACQQLESYLLSAPQGLMFGLVLFNDRTRVYRSQLAPATPESIAAALHFARYERADRGTWLQGGLSEALAFAAGESEASEETAADTVVVLCDGETGDASWVDGWLDEHNAVARLVFHCIQIGGTGTGALQALARASGGDFARIQAP